MKITVLTLFIFFLFNTFAYSQTDEDFISVATAKDGTEYYVYIEKAEYSTKSIWVKHTTPLKSFKNKKGKMVKSGGEKTLSFMTVDCAEREYTIQQSFLYNRNGDLKQEQDIPSYGNKVVPGSIMSAIYNFVCSDE